MEPARKESNISDIDLTDTDHCILCFNTIYFYALGKCGHKNVCHTCVLRMRIILKQRYCTICKTELEEIVISESKGLTWDEFQKSPKAMQDKVDPTIYYETPKAKAASLKLRSYTCLFKDCRFGMQDFHDDETLKRHMETEHQKTFCKICLKGRLVFIREQRLYHLKQLRNHIDYGDEGNSKQAEILPHPYCDFCEEYFFNDLAFFDHLGRNHLTCNLCGEAYKNVYYSSYISLETHFAWSHFLCPYGQCKEKCYVAFSTENELKTHLEIEHKSREKQINANALLGFEEEKFEVGGKHGGPKGKKG